MSTCYLNTENNKVLSQKQVRKEMYEKLLSDPQFEGLAAKIFSTTVTPKDRAVETISKIKAAAKVKGIDYEGVSHFLELKHATFDGGTPIYLAPKYIQEEYIRHYVEHSIKAGKNPTLAEEEVRQQIADSALETHVGTMLHKLVQILFETNGDYDSTEFLKAKQEILALLDKTTNADKQLLGENKTLREIITSDNPTLTDLEIIDTLVNNAKTLYNKIINKPEYKNAQFFSECELYGDDSIKTSDIKYKGLRGIADLIVVKEDGTIDIIDFKVCTRYYSDWCAAKQYHTEYQLGIYRLLLAQHGIDGSKIGLFVQPIYMNKTNAADSEVEKVMQDVLTSSHRNNLSRLDWEGGSFTENIKYLIPTRITMDLETSIEVNDKTIEKFLDMVDYNPGERTYTKEELIKRKLYESVEKGKKYIRSMMYIKDRE